MKFISKKNKLLFLAILSFVFVSSSALAISKSSFITIQPSNHLTIQPSKIFPPNPVLGVSTSFPVLSAQGVLAIDMDSGVPLYEKNPDAPLLPASTTKIDTALVSLDTYKLDQVLVIPPGVNVDGQKMGLYPGEKMTFENLLYGLLVYSANDAAEALAEDYPCLPAGRPCGYDAFIAAMNQKAKDLSMNNSHFQNPIGLDADEQRSTAKDLVRASEVAMKFRNLQK